MKPILKFAACILLTGALFYISCQKKFNCEDCKEGNKPPIAHAGKDTVIVLPVDSVMLDGRASTDPENNITGYAWRKISGPVAFNIHDASAASTLVKNIIAGSYEFELMVTDNAGLSAKDTIKITVDSTVITNHPPIAKAGNDTAIILPTNNVRLDGIASSDSENNITGYSWTKISGPTSFNIANANAVQTTVTNLVEGIYQFELKVTDAGGLFSRDTVQVGVNSVQLDPCAANRPFVNTQLVPLTSIPNLTHPNDNEYKIVAAGNKLLFISKSYWFAGAGHNPIYIYNIVSQNWSTAELSISRHSSGIATDGNKVYFAGGGLNDGNNIDTVFNTIDIYDASSNTWSVSSLSVPASCEDGVVLGNKIFFPSGSFVQIFNTSTGTCTTENLSIPRWGWSAVAAGNKVYFAGGYENNFTSGGGISGRVDVYDNSTNNWSQFSLIEPKVSMACVFVNDKIFWAGGRKAYLPTDTLSSLVQIFDINTGSSTTSCLHQSRMGLKAVLKDNKIVFFTGGEDSPQNKFDIYDIATNSWSIGVLPFNIQLATIASYNNTIYVGGGVVNGSWTPQVWKLEF